MWPKPWCCVASPFATRIASSARERAARTDGVTYPRRVARPILIVGDVQGDAERLAAALETWPEDEVDTIFLGDFFQGGPPGEAGGAAAARIARGRRNSRS